MKRDDAMKVSSFERHHADEHDFLTGRRVEVGC